MRIESRLLGALPGIRHGFFTRRGGVSEGPFASLNVGPTSGDLPERVAANRTRIATSLGVPPEHLLSARQVHGTGCLVAEDPWPLARRPEGDALLCRRPGLAVGVVTADCAPVLLADPVARRVAAVHAGWRGLLAGVLEETVRRLRDLGSRPEDLRAAVGPCIGAASYEVGPELHDAFLAADPAHERFFSARPQSDRLLFDLAGCCRHVLLRAGLHADRVEVLGHDTFAEEERFFSYRRSRLRGEPRFGVQLSAILLEG
ncbi:MAG TPA: peptidoglycan editing factor PgeF [Rhodospirillales bacterium]|nr:peptidoglycan editing factor PgeF [Rhodospirillales bacterium]